MGEAVAVVVLGRVITLDWYLLLPFLSSDPGAFLCQCAAWGVHGPQVKGEEGDRGDSWLAA